MTNKIIIQNNKVVVALNRLKQGLSKLDAPPGPDKIQRTVTDTTAAWILDLQEASFICHNRDNDVYEKEK